MRKNPHDRISKLEPKEQYLSTVLKSCSTSFILFKLCLYQYKAFSLKNGFVNKFKPIFRFDLETGQA